MTRMRLMLPALVATLASTAWADDASAQSPYSQVRSAIDTMESFEASLTRDIERRRSRGRGKSIECMIEQKASVQALLDLSRIERAELVEAMADQDSTAVARSHRNVMVWNVKAKVAADKVSGCPSQRDYDVAKAIAEAEALGRD